MMLLKLPIIFVGLRMHSSPCWPTDKGCRVTISTILASIFCERRPTHLSSEHSSGPIVQDMRPVSVEPYPCHVQTNLFHVYSNIDCVCIHTCMHVCAYRYIYALWCS